MFEEFQQFLGLKKLTIQYLHVAPMYLAKFQFNLRRCHLKNLKTADILDIGTNNLNNFSLHVALLPPTKFQLNSTYLFYLKRILHECSCFIEFILTNWGKEIKYKACRAFYLFLTTCLINFIIHEHKCYILFII